MQDQSYWGLKLDLHDLNKEMEVAQVSRAGQARRSKSAYWKDRQNGAGSRECAEAKALLINLKDRSMEINSYQGKREEANKVKGSGGVLSRLTINGSTRCAEYEKGRLLWIWGTWENFLEGSRLVQDLESRPSGWERRGKCCRQGNSVATVT